MKKVDISKNEWHPKEDLDEVIAAIKKFAKTDYHNPDRWSWIRNTECKYVGLRFDMRDGAFVIYDRKDERILLSDVEYQYKEEDGDK